MQVRCATRSDVAAMHRWLAKHGIDLKTQEPGQRFVVPGVAMGSLVYGEGLAIVTGYVTNPLCSSETRHAALASLTDFLIKEAQSLGINRLLAYTTDAQILTRAEAAGFRKLPHTLMARG